MTVPVPRSAFRVLHVASGREWRGGQRQVLYLAEALAARGIQQVVVTGAGTRLERELLAAGCPVAATPWTTALDPRVIAAIVRAARSSSTRPLLHAHDPHALTLASLAALRLKAPLLVTRRVDFPLRRPWLWRRATRVIAISEAVRGVLEAGGVPSEQITVVHSGIPLAQSSPMPLALHAQLGLPNDAPLAVSVGALVPHKDYPALLSAAGILRERCPALQWVIAGEGPERARLEQLIDALALAERVHLLGQVDDGRRVIAAGDLFIASSREEGLNTSVLDALHLGVPVVSTSAGGLPEAVGEAGVLVPPRDPDALAEAIERLLTDPAERERIRVAGRAQAASFSSDRMAEAMLAVYDSVAPAP